MEIINELGYGMFGTTYKIKKNNNYYAMKIEHILEEDKIESTKSPHWREIRFAQQMNKLYPDQFMKLYEYDIIDECEHEQKYTIPFDNINKYWKNKINKLAKSKFCIRKIYELMDGTIEKLIYKLNDKEKYSVIAQLACIVKIMEKHKYIHGDFHSGNIGYIETDKKYVNILGNKIPTYGYIVKAIDYGSLMHKSYDLNNREKKNYKSILGTEFISIINTVMRNNNDFFEFAEQNKIKLIYKKDLKKILNSDLNNILKEYTDNKDFKFILAEVMYPDEFQKIILGKYYKKTIPSKIYFDVQDFIYFVSVNLNLNKIIEYCMIKLKL